MPRDLADIVGFVHQDPEAQFVVDRVEHDVAFALENLGLDENLSEILVADSVSEQADKAIALLNDASLWQRASDSLRLLAEERYTNRVFETALNDFLRALGI